MRDPWTASVSDGTSTQTEEQTPTGKPWISSPVWICEHIVQLGEGPISKKGKRQRKTQTHGEGVERHREQSVIQDACDSQ